MAMADEDYTEHTGTDRAPVTVHRFDSKKRKTETFIEKVDASGSSEGLVTFQVSADGNNVLYEHGGNWFIVDADKPPKDDDGKIAWDAVTVWVDPRAEWKQMFHEIWRVERDFLYDPHAHGLDLAKAEKTYAPFLDGISGRADLNALFEEMLSNLVLGHVWGRVAPTRTRRA